MQSLARRMLRPSAQIRRFSTAPTAPEVPVSLSEGEQHIVNKLTERFSPSRLQVQDVSGGCGSFYAVTIASTAFKGLPIVKQHKLVTEALKEEIAGIHGLQVNDY
ncbi:bola protein [Mycena floridula]|nr:bola protein [Mycena floridula]